MAQADEDKKVTRARVIRHAKNFWEVAARNGCTTGDVVNIALVLIGRVRDILKKSDMPDAWKEIQEQAIREINRGEPNEKEGQDKVGGKGEEGRPEGRQEGIQAGIKAGGEEGGEKISSEVR